MSFLVFLVVSGDIYPKKNFVKFKTSCAVFFWDAVQHIAWKKNTKIVSVTARSIWADGIYIGGLPTNSQMVTVRPRSNSGLTTPCVGPRGLVTDTPIFAYSLKFSFLNPRATVKFFSTAAIFTLKVIPNEWTRHFSKNKKLCALFFWDN